MNSKGQSALEYVITNGWAVFVMVLVIGLIFSLGFFNPYTFREQTCRGFDKIRYQDHQASASEQRFSIVFSNWSNKEFEDGDYNVYLDCDRDLIADLVLDSNTDANTENWIGRTDYYFHFYLDGNTEKCDTGFSAGDRYNYDIWVQYNSDLGFQRKELGTCLGFFEP